MGVFDKTVHTYIHAYKKKHTTAYILFVDPFSEAKKIHNFSRIHPNMDA